MRVPITYFVILSLFLSAPAQAGFFDKAKQAARAAAEKAKEAASAAATVTVATTTAATTIATDSCSTLMTGAMEKAEALVEGATEGVNRIVALYDEFLQVINLDGIGQNVSGGAIGAKELFLQSLSITRVATMAYRIFTFDTDIKGLRTGIFEPLTKWITDLKSLQEASISLSREDYAKQQVILYGQLTALIFEVTCKSYKLIPQTVVNFFPAFGGVMFSITTKEPESMDQLAAMVLKQFLKNAWQALTTKGLTMDERFALLNTDMASLQAAGQFANETGITDFFEALKSLKP